MPETINTKLTYIQYFTLANEYLDAYTEIAKRIQESNTALPQNEKKDLYTHSEPLLQQAYEFQKMGFSELTADLKSSVSDLEAAVKDATRTIKLIYKVGKFIEVVSDLVAIGAVLAVPAIKPESLVVLPSLLKELKSDVSELKKAA